MSEIERACCPKCGGTSGYSLAFRSSGREHKTWEGDDVDYHTDRCVVGTARKCDDCGRVVNGKRTGGKHGK
jgi:hypothetical protein